MTSTLQNAIGVQVEDAQSVRTEHFFLRTSSYCLYPTDTFYKKCFKYVFK